VIEEIVARQRDHIDHSEPGVEQAMRAIVRGHLYEDDTGGSTFGYAVERFCDYYGKMQANTEVCPFGFNALRELDAALREAGVTELLSASFIGWDPPIPLSERPDFPSITTFDAQVCRGAQPSTRRRFRPWPTPLGGAPSCRLQAGCGRAATPGAVSSCSATSGRVRSPNRTQRLLSRHSSWQLPN
jgi:hypothetical protein